MATGQPQPPSAAPPPREIVGDFYELACQAHALSQQGKRLRISVDVADGEWNSSVMEELDHRRHVEED